MAADYPDNPAVRATWLNGNPQTVVPYCILCDGVHWHGHEPELFDGTRERSHRVAHCGPNERDEEALRRGYDGYYLTPMNYNEYWIIEGDLGSKVILIEKGSELEDQLGRLADR